MDMIVNKVAQSGIVTLDPAGFLPKDDETATFDLKPFLFKEMILKEKDYRGSLQEHDWKQYEGKSVAITCTADAIIPMWAYMLAATYLQQAGAKTFFGSEEQLKANIMLQKIEKVNAEEYTEKRVVLKGCGEKPIPEAAYVALTERLLPVVKSLMYGEPCSTVPIYKKK